MNSNANQHIALEFSMNFSRTSAQFATCHQAVASPHAGQNLLMPLTSITHQSVEGPQK